MALYMELHLNKDEKDGKGEGLGDDIFSSMEQYFYSTFYTDPVDQSRKEGGVPDTVEIEANGKTTDYDRDDEEEDNEAGMDGDDDDDDDDISMDMGNRYASTTTKHQLRRSRTFNGRSDNGKPRSGGGGGVSGGILHASKHYAGQRQLSPIQFKANNPTSPSSASAKSVRWRDHEKKTTSFGFCGTDSSLADVFDESVPLPVQIQRQMEQEQNQLLSQPIGSPGLITGPTAGTGMSGAQQRSRRLQQGDDDDDGYDQPQGCLEQLLFLGKGSKSRNAKLRDARAEQEEMDSDPILAFRKHKLMERRLKQLVMIDSEEEDDFANLGAMNKRKQREASIAAKRKQLELEERERERRKQEENRMMRLTIGTVGQEEGGAAVERKPASSRKEEEREQGVEEREEAPKDVTSQPTQEQQLQEMTETTKTTKVNKTTGSGSSSSNKSDEPVEESQSVENHYAEIIWKSKGKSSTKRSQSTSRWGRKRN